MDEITFHTVLPPEEISLDEWKASFKVGSLFSYLDAHNGKTLAQIEKEAAIRAAKVIINQNNYEQEPTSRN